MIQKDSHIDNQTTGLSSFRLLSSRRKQLQSIKAPFYNQTYLTEELALLPKTEHIQEKISSKRTTRERPRNLQRESFSERNKTLLENQIMERRNSYSYSSSQKTKLLNLEKKEVSHEAFQLKNSQKLDRLQSLREQQEEHYKLLSKKILNKIEIKQKRNKSLSTPSSINKVTWYKKWRNEERMGEHRLQEKILNRLKSHESQRAKSLKEKLGEISMKRYEVKNEIFDKYKF